MKNAIKIFLVFSMSCFQVIGQEGEKSFSLVEAEAYALEHNENIKNADLDVLAAEKKIWETIAIGLPQAQLEGQFQQLIDIPVTVVDASLFNPAAPAGSVMEFKMGQEFSTSATLSVNQLLFDGSYIVGLQFTKFYKKISETAFLKSQQDTKALVREAYYNILIAQQNVDLLDSIALTTKKLWDQSQGYYEAGFLLKEDLDQFEITFNRMELNLKNAKNQLLIAKNMLKLQLGISMKETISLSQNFEEVLKEIESNNPALQSFNIENNFDFQMVNQQKTLDEYSLKNEKAKYLPSAYAFLSHAQNAYRSEFDFFQDKAWYPTTVWGIGVTVPITTSGQKVMKVQQAEIKIQQDQNSIEQLKRGLEFQELQLKAMFINAYEKMHLEEQNVSLAQNIYQKSLERKEVGAVSALDVTQKQNQLLQAEGNYIAAIMEMLNYKIQLDKLYNQ
ncbi:hypothetical protein DNU06_05005 [Putridiphycobacter roseus]|uniref:TolC family protein n=1 Tax=Putridiphycobacter roseus TaxID=2219161 RepID=A0A2W1N347_9FLAO|nr:TolC family protein [Putridiphycobacter roseus]PZE17980.1 hypothetical protein DNU06_05005 [Putridiphycobacter roseus]